MSEIEDRESLINILRALGLTKYEALAYVASLSLGEATATEIRKDAGIPHPRIYDVLESLCRKGLVEVTGSRPRKYRAIDPEIALENLKEKFIQKIDRAKETLKKISKEEEKLEPNVWLLYNYDNILSRIRQVIEETKYECLLSIPISSLAKLEDSLKSAISRSVRPLIVLFRDGVKSKESLDLKPLKGACILFREVPGSILCIADCTHVVITSYRTFSQKNARYGISVTDPELANTLSFFFYYSFFKDSKPIVEVDIEDYVGTWFTSIWRAVHVIREAMRDNLKARVLVKGYDILSGREITVEGWVKQAIEDEKRHVYSIVLDNGVSIGGYSAVLEDVEARLIKILEVKSSL